VAGLKGGIRNSGKETKAKQRKGQWRRLHGTRGARGPHFYKWLGTGGHHEQENSEEETEQTALTITKALTETTNCTIRAKKVEGHDQKKISRRFAPDRCPPPLSLLTGAPTFKFVPSPVGRESLNGSERKEREARGGWDLIQ